MSRLTKNGLRISFVLVALGIVLWCGGFFSTVNAEDFNTLAIYFFVSSVFFASPHMIIKPQNGDKKSRLETSADLAVSSFYSAALLFVLFNAIPYFNSGTSSISLQFIGQALLAISFAWTLCLHLWSAFFSLSNLLRSAEG